MITEREQKWIDALKAVRSGTGEAPLEGKKLQELVMTVQVLLPLWDNILPVIVADIVNAVKKAQQS